MKPGVKTTVKAFAGVIILFAVAMSFSVSAEIDFDKKLHRIHIPAMNAADALNELAFQTGTVLLFPYKEVDSLQANEVVGQYTLKQAIKVLLKNSGLHGSLTKDGAIRISKAGDQRQKKSGWERDMNSKKKLLASVMGLIVGGGNVAPVLAEGVTEQGRIDEVVVTASKRATGIQDTPMAISALSNNTIHKRGLVGMEDYLSTLPGVTMQDRGAGQNTITIRGIGTGSQFDTNPTVGVYFGETSLVGLGTPTNGNLAGSADIKLVDIERIEVLRGPQGSLYGSGSMGGTVRVIPVAPNLEKVQGKIATSYSQTDEQGGDNSMIQGAISVPVIDDELAIRAVAYRFDNSGFIDNVAASNPTPNVSAAVAASAVALDEDGIGSDEYTGYRLTALWRPINELDITLSYIDQEIGQEGAREVNTNLPGKFQQARLSINPDGDGEERGTDTSITNLTLEYDFGWGSVLSSTSQIDHIGESKVDLTSLDGDPRNGLADNAGDTDVFIEELRFVSQFNGPLQILAGYYYEDRKSDADYLFRWTGAQAAPAPDFLFSFREDLTQQAFFGELSYDLTKQVTATAGFRYFDYDQSVPFIRFDGIDSNVDDLRASTNDSIFKFNLSYHLNEDTLLYVQWAEGFRPGRLQSQVLPADDADNDGLVEFTDGTEREVTEGFVEPDTVENYELGLKSTLLDNRLTLNASIFRIDWEGIPVSLRSTSRNVNFFFNVGKSESEGIELEVQAELTESLYMQLSSSYVETVLEEDAPSLGNKGDNLPGSADFNFSGALEYQFDLSGYESFVRIDYSYVDEYYHNFSEAGEASGGYSQVNLKVGTRLEGVDIDLSVINLTNADDFTWVDNNFGMGRAYRLRPRTVGLNIGYRF